VVIPDPVAEALEEVETPEPEKPEPEPEPEKPEVKPSQSAEPIPEVIPAWALDLKANVTKLLEVESGRQRERQETERKAKRTDRRSIFDGARAQADRDRKRVKRRGANLFRD
jgi:colicin import membrane protein